MAEVTPIQAVRWRCMVDDRPWTVESVVIVGKNVSKYVLIDAGRNPDPDDRSRATWGISAMSVMYVGGRESWILGRREFTAYPTEQELADFLRYVHWGDHGGFRIEFDGKVDLKHPSKR